MVKSFKTNSEYESYVSGGLIAGELYWVEEDKSVHFRTNNIDGKDKVYNIGVGDDLVPEGNIAITENGEDIDVAEYATATVNVPIPQGYIQPSGNYAISENGTDIDVAQYATVSVSVSAPAPTWNTLSGESLQMTVGTTYMFKTNVSGVYMWPVIVDSDGDGEIDYEDEPTNSIGQMVANTVYYYTATTENPGVYGNQSTMYFSGSMYSYDTEPQIGGTPLPAGAVIQYAVLPTA